MKTLIKAVLRFLARRPTSVAGVSIFAIGFSIVAGNALYYQPGKHPVPLWATRDVVTTRSLPPAPAKGDTRLAPPTQLPNIADALPPARIPVPTARPDFRTDTGQPNRSMISSVQLRLKQGGFYAGEVDGLSGPMTRAAIAQYQTAHGIPGNGEISSELLDHLAANRSRTDNIAEVKSPAAPITPSQARAEPVTRPVVERIETVLRQEEETVLAQPAIHQPETVVIEPRLVKTTPQGPARLEVAAREHNVRQRDEARPPQAQAFAPGVHEIRDSALVARVQIGLINFGETGISVDGVMTDQTRAAIRAFQSRYGLAVTGVPDLAVIRKMEQIGALQKS